VSRKKTKEKKSLREYAQNWDSEGLGREGYITTVPSFIERNLQEGGITKGAWSGKGKVGRKKKSAKYILTKDNRECREWGQKGSFRRRTGRSKRTEVTSGCERSAGNFLTLAEREFEIAVPDEADVYTIKPGKDRQLDSTRGRGGLRRHEFLKTAEKEQKNRG